MYLPLQPTWNGSYLHFANGSSTFMDSCMRTSTCRRAWATSSVTTRLTRIHIRDGGSPREIYFLPFQNFHLPKSKSQVDCWLLSRNQKNTKGTSSLDFDSLSSIFILHSKLEFFQWIAQPWLMTTYGLSCRFRGSVDVQPVDVTRLDLLRRYHLRVLQELRLWHDVRDPQMRCEKKRRVF